MNTVRAALVRVMPPATETAERNLLLDLNEVAV